MQKKKYFLRFKAFQFRQNYYKFFKKQEDKLLQFTNKNNFTKNKGVQPKFIDLKDKLYEFFEFNRNLGNAVTIKALLLQMIKLDEENKNNKNNKYFGIKNDNFITNYTRIERFMDRKRLSIRQNNGMGRKFY